MLKLLKGEIRFFTFEQYTNEPFKIIALSKFGQVRLHLNQSIETPNKKTWTIDELNVKEFQTKSEYLNTINVGTKDKGYCTNCDYFVAAEALETTFATLYLVYPETVVPLLRNKFFSDFIVEKGASTLASYNNIEKTKLQITVHSGELEVTASYKGTYKSTQIFKVMQTEQDMTIDIS